MRQLANAIVAICILISCLIFCAEASRQSGIITTVAGNGNQSFSGDLGPATAASLDYPRGIAIATSGSLFIADANDYRIREVSASVPALAATVYVDLGELDLYVAQGSTQSQSLQIAGVAGIKWQATATTSTGGVWLIVSPGTGQTPATLTASVNAGSLTQGNYQRSITIRAPDAIPPSITINVTLQVYYVPPQAYQITNSASGYVSGENGAGIAQGSLFVVCGNYLGPAILQFPIPLSLDGTSVQIKMPNGTYNAPLIYTSYSQVAAILASALPPGAGMLVVTYNGTAAAPIPIKVVKSAFGIFTVTSNGAGAWVIQDAHNNQLTFAQPAHPGDIVLLWGTGLGPVDGVETTGPLSGNLFTAEVFVGNQAAAVQYAGRSGCCAALDEIAFQIPPGVQGCFVPVAVRSSAVVSSFVSLPIAPAGEACSDPVGLTPDLLTKASTGNGLAIGAIALGRVPALQNFGASFLQGMSERLSALLGTKVTEQDLRTIVRASHARHGRAWKAVIKEYAPILKAGNIDPATIVSMASALNYLGVAAAFQQGMSPAGFSWQFAATLPPPGTCTAGLESSYQSASQDVTIQPDDAGPQLLLTGPASAQTLDQTSSGVYQLSLTPDPTNFGLPGGTYFVSSNGENDVEAFSASLQIGSPLTWINKPSVGFIDRNSSRG